MKFSRVLWFPGLPALVLATAATAGVNTWTLNGPGGGLTRSVAIHPTNASVVLASTGTGMYRSANGGSTWTHVGDAASVDNIVFDPTNANRVYALGGGRAGLWRSDDAGATFALSSVPATRFLTASRSRTTARCISPIAKGACFAAPTWV
jgi:hypothetical protein